MFPERPSLALMNGPDIYTAIAINKKLFPQMRYLRYWIYKNGERVGATRNKKEFEDYVSSQKSVYAPPSTKQNETARLVAMLEEWDGNKLLTKVITALKAQQEATCKNS